MCCGCCRLMNAKGSPVGNKRKTPPIDPAGGLIAPIDIHRFTKAFKWLAKAASFETPEAADEAAKKAGWTVNNKEGDPDHRCPRCQEDPEHVNRRGAYINWETLNPANASDGAEPRAPEANKEQ